MLRRSLALLVAVSLLTVATAAQAAESGGALSHASATSVKTSPLDLAIIFIYLIGIVALGCWAGTRRTGTDGSGYFLAGKSLSWPVIGLALFATNISTLHLVSFAQNGYTSGLTYGNFEWMAAFTLVILALFFAPFYLQSRVATLPDFMEKRYSRGCRDFLALLSIFSAIVVHIGFSLHTGAIVLEGTVLPSMGVENPEQYHLWTIVGLCGVTAIYTIVGGLLAVVLTESIQTIVLLAGAVCITAIGFHMVGGWSELRTHVHPVNLSILRSSNDPTGITWYAVFLGYPVLGVWYWCTDQTIVQRVLGAKDENHARLGPLFAGFIKILPVFLFVLPGVICLALVNKGTIPPLPTDGQGSPLTERAYTHMINVMLWPGMQGIVIAAMLAALMSTVSGALNSIATLVSYDIYKRWKPNVDDKQLVWVGRMATFVAMFVAIAWSMALARSDTTIFQAMVDMFPGVAPPTAVVFLWGIFWRRASSKAALWTLIGGPVVGLAISLLKVLSSANIIHVPPGGLLADVLAINSLLMAFLLFVAESVFLIVVSLIYPHDHTDQSESLVWKKPWDALRRSETTWRGLLDFRVAAFLLVATMVGLYIGFSSDETYYPLSGIVTLDGRAVTGAEVHFQTNDPLLDAQVSTGTSGEYAVGTTQMAGGAPAGTKYQVRIEPAFDYVVRLKPGSDGAIEKVLAFMPTGTPVDEQTDAAGTKFVIHTKPEQQIAVPPGDDVKLLRATPIPEKYRSFNTSGLDLVVRGDKADMDLNLRDK